MGLAELVEINFSLVPAKAEAMALVPARRSDYAVATTEERRLAMERLEFCRLAMAVKGEFRVGLEKACEMVAIRHADRFPELLRRGKGGKSALSYNNARHWIDLLGKGKDGKPCWENSAALCDNYARGQKERPGDPLFWETFFSLYLNRACLSIPEAHLKAAAKIRELNAFAVIPAEHQARYQVELLDSPTIVMARFGEEALKNGYIDYIRRDWTDVEPGMMVIADTRTHDTAIKVWDEEKQAWTARRPNLCAMIDARSWVVLGWCVTAESPDADIIANTLALAIYNMGMRCPKYYYSDNGKDFTKAGFATDIEIDGRKTCILRELGISDVTSLPYNGKAKTVERFFRDCAEHFDKAQDCYLGNKPGARPDSAAFFWKHPEMLPTREEFCERLSAFFCDYYSRPKFGKIHGGKSPLELWNSRKIDAPVWTAEQLRFAMLLPMAESRTVHRGPAISVGRVEYYAPELYRLLDKKVMVKIDRLNPERVFAFESDGRLICECKTRQAIKALALDDEGRKQIAEALARQRRQIKDTMTVLNELTGGKYLASPSQILAAPVDAEMVKAGEMRSVKGASHKFQVYKLVSPNETESGKTANPATESEIPAMELEFKEDRVEARMKEFERLAIDKPEDKTPAPSQEQMAKFHAMMRQRKRNEEEEF